MGCGVMVELAENMTDVNAVIKTPEIWGQITDEGAENKEYAPKNTDSEFWLIAKTDRICGAIFVEINSSVSISIHPYSIDRGKGYYMMKAFLKWFLSETAETLNKINARIPTYNGVGELVALKLGFTNEGINRQSHKCGGELYDQIMMGITRSEVKEVLKWVT